MILETERLYLRQLEVSDAPYMSEYRNKEEVAQYQSWDHYSLEDALRRIQQCQLIKNYNQPKTDYHLGIVLKDTHILIGDLFIEIINKKVFVLGYTFNSCYWKQGYATEMISAFLNYMKETYQFKKVICYVYVDNTNSIKLLKRLGFTKFDESYYYNDVGYIKKLR
ncbi:MAG: GNAT family N-acetyltransferase [Coprobacillus sp.]|jgi:ribosomal-protein-alanine N-acetyltransferase|nr:GNAT family N-acetyltransferase [Coprobacillus sp.]